MRSASELARPEDPATLYAAYWQEFMAWARDCGASQRLDIPENLGGVFIPRQILEMAEDPGRVRTLYTEEADPRRLGVLIYERKNHSLTDPLVFDQYTAGMDLSGARQYRQNIPFYVDPMHVRFRKQIYGGRLTLNDKVYLAYQADASPDYPHVLMTRNLVDRPELHRRGIGTSFYQRLEDIYRTLGFEYLLEFIVSGHPGFFDKIRTPYFDLSMEDKLRLPPSVAKFSPLLMVKKLQE